MISIIHEPAFGKVLSILVHVPMINNGMHSPMPKKKSKRKPSNLLPRLVTILNNNNRPGDKHGDATVPLIAPKMKAEGSELFFKVVGFCSNAGIYMGYNPRSEKPRYTNNITNNEIKNGCIISVPII